MGSTMKKRSLKQPPLELANFEEQSKNQIVHQQSNAAGCLAVCQLGHQVLPLENQARFGSGQDGEQDKRARTQRLRARLDEAASRVELHGPAPRYLHAHLNFIYYVCMIPYKRESKPECQATTQSGKRCLRAVQKAVFWLLMSLASINAALVSKLTFLRFLASRKPTEFIDFGSSVATLLIGIAWLILWTYWVDRVNCTLDSIEIYEERIVETNAKKNGGMRQPVENIYKWIFLFEVVSWTVAILKSVFYDDLLNWTLEDFVLDSSEFTAELLFNWEVEKNRTLYWHKNYGLEYTATSVSLGCFGILIWFTSIFLLITIRDTVFMMTCTLGSNVYRFIRNIVDFANLPTREVRDEDCKEMEEHWALYLVAQDMVKDMNWTFGVLVKILHVGNELFLVNFMKCCLQTNIPGTLLLGMLYTITKFMIGYIYAAFIHQYNAVCENWITNWSRGTDAIQIGNVQVKASSTLKQMKRDPFAIGDGHFVVNQLFVFKFICFGVTLVMYYISEATMEGKDAMKTE